MNLFHLLAKVSVSAMLIAIVLSFTSCTSLKQQDVVRFVLIADPQMGFSNPANYSSKDLDYFKLTVDKINSLSTPGEFTLILGDMVHNQSDEQVQWPDYHGALASMNIPYHEVMGNHDGWNTKGLVRWRDTWQKQDVYSFNHKGLFFIGLNSYFLKKPDDLPVETSAQKSFITSQLKSNAANPHKFIFQHFPLYRDTPNEEEQGNRNLPIPERNFMLEQLERYQVKAMFSGHSHYEIIRDYKGTLLLAANPSSRTLGTGKRGFYIVDYKKSTQELSFQFIENTEAELDDFLMAL